MAKIVNIDLSEVETLSELGKALSSPVRIEMLQVLYEESLIIGEIAKRMNLPQSSTAFHLKILEQAGLIRMEQQPGERGAAKLCTRKVDTLSIDMFKKGTEEWETYTTELPVGAYSSCQVTPTCGLFDQTGSIGSHDAEYCFYDPRRLGAGLLWTSSGYVEYQYPNGMPLKADIRKVTFSAEICSEAPAYNENWKSDITIWINGVDCGTWTCPSDFGARRGRLNPSFVHNGSSQYGILMNWEIFENGVFANGEQISDTTISDLNLMRSPYITVRIGNKPDTRYVGGFNLFGKHFGDYNQDLILSVEYV